MLNGIITPLTADPLFDFLCVSVRLFQILFIQDGTSQIWEKNKKKGGERAGWERMERVRVRSEVLAALPHYQSRSEDQTWRPLIGSDLERGNSRVRSSGPAESGCYQRDGGYE